MFANAQPRHKGPQLHQRTLHQLDTTEKTQRPNHCGRRKSHGNHSGYLTLTLFFIALSVWLGLQVIAERHKTHRNTYEYRSSPTSATAG